MKQESEIQGRNPDDNSLFSKAQTSSVSERQQKMHQSLSLAPQPAFPVGSAVREMVAWQANIRGLRAARGRPMFACHDRRDRQDGLSSAAPRPRHFRDLESAEKSICSVKSQTSLPGVQGAEADDTDITRFPVLFLLF